jgi:hypothetical protein
MLICNFNNFVGMLDYTFRWTMSSAALLGRSKFWRKRAWGNKVRGYGNNMAIVDTRTVDAETYQPCSMFGHQMKKQNKGVSHAFKDTPKVKDAIYKATMTGGAIDAATLKDIFTILLINIGTAGMIFPNKVVVLNPEFPYYRVNPTEIVMNAGYSVLAVLFFMDGDRYTPAGLKHLDKLIRSATVHLLKLFEMKQKLAGVESVNITVIKLKLCLHFPANIRSLGSPPFFDTSDTENAHRWIAKLYRQSSGRASSCAVEMMQTAISVGRAQGMEDRLNSGENSSGVVVVREGLRRQQDACNGEESDPLQLHYIRVDNKCSILPQFGSVLYLWREERGFVPFEDVIKVCKKFYLLKLSF